MLTPSDGLAPEYFDLNTGSPDLFELCNWSTPERPESCNLTSPNFIDIDFNGGTLDWLQREQLQDVSQLSNASTSQTLSHPSISVEFQDAFGVAAVPECLKSHRKDGVKKTRRPRVSRPKTGVTQLRKLLQEKQQQYEQEKALNHKLRQRADLAKRLVDMCDWELKLGESIKGRKICNELFMEHIPEGFIKQVCHSVGIGNNTVTPTEALVAIFQIVARKNSQMLMEGHIAEDGSISSELHEMVSHVFQLNRVVHVLYPEATMRQPIDVRTMSLKSPGQQHWQTMVTNVGFSREQKAALATAYELIAASHARAHGPLYGAMARHLADLVGMQNTTTYNFSQSIPLLELMEKPVSLAAATLSAHLHYNMMIASGFTTAQAAKACVSAYPYFPDIVPITNILLEDVFSSLSISNN